VASISLLTPLNPSLLKQTIVRKEPDFDERDHGFEAAAERTTVARRRTEAYV
jgi:hypothetical protein